MEGLVGLVIEGANFALESFRFVEEVFLEGSEVVGEFFPEESTAGHEGSLALKLVEAWLS